MPARESYVQSIRTPQTYTLRDGRTVEVRNGCLVESKTREVLTGSEQTTAYLLANAKLHPDDRAWLETWGETVCDRMSSQDSMRMASGGLPRSNRIVERMKEEVA
jgi:hypothetical protein